MVDISKPLYRGRHVSLEDGKTHWVSFKYERLLNLYYWCGCLTHNDRDCEKWIESEVSLKPKEQKFGSWLRAPPFFTSRKMLSRFKVSLRRKNRALPPTPSNLNDPFLRQENNNLPLKLLHIPRGHPLRSLIRKNLKLSRQRIFHSKNLLLVPRRFTR